MRVWMRRLGVMLLFLGVAICFAPTLVPPFLDRVYYDGPTSGHYDGERFFNLGGTAAAVEAHERGRFDFLFRSWMGAGAEWPERIAVTPTVPPRRVAGGAMRVTWIGHSTVLVQTRGLNILTDPVWSERVSPFSFIGPRSEEHTSELQSLMRISYAVFCLKKKKNNIQQKQ